MKAIRVSQFGGPEVLNLVEVETPQPGPGQILVRLHAIGVNPVETYFRSGSNPNLKLPYTPGSDGAGIAQAIGPGVTRVKLGDRVYTSGSVSGTYAEFALCAESDVYHLPENITFNQGAALSIPYATSYRALFHRAQAQPGETVLVHGASGGVGIAAVQWARAHGMTVIGTGGSDEGRILVLEQGAHHALDHRQINYLDEALELTARKGVDVILEMLANVNLGKDLPILAQRGRVVVIGSRGKVEITPRDAMSRDASILAMTLFNASPAELQSIHRAMKAGLENGALRPIVGQELPLSEARQAHRSIMEPGARGKMILVP